MALGDCTEVPRPICKAGESSQYTYLFPSLLPYYGTSIPDLHEFFDNYTVLY